MAAAGTSLGTLVRSLSGGGGRRLLSGIFAGGSSFFGTMSRVARLLFLQVTGFLFLVLAVGLGAKAWHEHQVVIASHGSPTRFYLSTFFFVLFTYFGLSSFWRARK